MTELDFAKKIRGLCGTAYLVGGAVRDKFRGVEAHDKDYCVTGVEEKIFAETFPNASKFGKSFPVYSVEIDGKFCEVAFARTEKKIDGLSVLSAVSSSSKILSVGSRESSSPQSFIASIVESQISKLN